MAPPTTTKRPNRVAPKQSHNNLAPDDGQTTSGDRLYDAARAASNFFDRRHSRPRATGRKSGNGECHQCASIMDHRRRHRRPIRGVFCRREQAARRQRDSPSTDSSALTHRPRLVNRSPTDLASKTGALVRKHDRERACTKNARALQISAVAMSRSSGHMTHELLTTPRESSTDSSDQDDDCPPRLSDKITANRRRPNVTRHKARRGCLIALFIARSPLSKSGRLARSAGRLSCNAQRSPPIIRRNLARNKRSAHA
uniref:Uncharacterized protein n=1 Tax=Plectus sambesii TaxID=2011161 RepID=A0A914UJA2_9BILA